MDKPNPECNYRALQPMLATKMFIGFPCAIHCSSSKGSTPNLGFLWKSHFIWEDAELGVWVLGVFAPTQNSEHQL